VLRDHGHRAVHAAAVSASLSSTALKAIVHTPEGLRLGEPEADRAFGGLLSYAAELGAEQVVYHALALPDRAESEPAVAAEERSLAAMVALAERLEVTLAIENLAPLYPGPEPLSASPITLRGLALRLGSERVALCLDLGHAHITADLRHTDVERLCEPALDAVGVFHLHDNFGARWTRAGDELGVDLHLPPGRGTAPWDRIRELVAGHRAPLICEVHPPYLPRAAELHSTSRRLLG
jgi:sugar phosphate isomerase/epimerase